MANGMKTIVSSTELVSRAEWPVQSGDNYIWSPDDRRDDFLVWCCVCWIRGGGTTFCNAPFGTAGIWQAFQTGPNSISFRAQDVGQVLDRSTTLFCQCLFPSQHFGSDGFPLRGRVANRIFTQSNAATCRSSALRHWPRCIGASWLEKEEESCCRDGGLSKIQIEFRRDRREAVFLFHGDVRCWHLADMPLCTAHVCF